MQKSKIVNRIFSVIWWSVIAILALTLGKVLVSKIKGEVPSVFNYSVLKIVSGSMEDTIHTGSYILVKKVDPEDIKENDIISFYSQDPIIYGLPNTHRVVDIINVDGKYEFVTKGDANVANDLITAKQEDLIGIYVKELKVLTSFSTFLQGKTMFIMLMVLQVTTCGIIVYFILNKRKEDNDDEKTKE